VDENDGAYPQEKGVSDGLEAAKSGYSGTTALSGLKIPSMNLWRRPSAGEASPSNNALYPSITTADSDHGKLLAKVRNTTSAGEGKN